MIVIINNIIKYQRQKHVVKSMAKINIAQQ